MKINFKKPKYIIPLILLSFILVFYLIINNWSGKKADVPMVGNVESVEFYGGAVVVRESTSGMFWGLGGPAITLGNIIVGDRDIEANPNNSLFQHEYGRRSN